MPRLRYSAILFAHLAVAAGLGWSPHAATAASFACELAKTSVEMAICESPKLSELDEYLARYYAGARGALRHADQCLASDQRSWLQSTRNRCKDTDCLQRAYLQRLSVLHAVQPGATSLRSLDLPKSPSLVWIVPPAADPVAAPGHRHGVPLVARGQIVNEVSAGDGYVLNLGAGRRHLIAPLMFLEAPTSEALAQLAKNDKFTYEVRGRAEGGAQQPHAFSPAHCIYVYRIAP